MNLTVALAYTPLKVSQYSILKLANFVKCFKIISTNILLED